MLAKKLLLLTSLFAGGFIMSHAQGFYDDDIYYNPAKDTKAKQELADKAAKKATQKAAQYNYDPTLGGHDYYGADAYQVVGTSARDVDEYNRRGAYAPADSTLVGAGGDDFTYTRRIEKYHNGDIITDLNDPELVEYYYSSQPDVNIIINAPGYGWGSPWGYNYYAWNSPWYWNSWDWYWGPSWSWGWGGPGWGWGPSWSWGWGPGWGWGGPVWGPGWGYPGWGPSWGPSWTYNPGSSTGRRPVGIRNGYTGVGNNSLRPSGSSAPNRGGITHESLGNYRPGSSAGRPSHNQGNNNTYRPSNNNSRPSNNNGTWGTTNMNRGRNNNSYNNNNNYNNNRSYSTPSYNSGGSSRGGGFSGGGGGGGSHRGGRR